MDPMSESPIARWLGLFAERADGGRRVELNPAERDEFVLALNASGQGGVVQFTTATAAMAPGFVGTFGGFDLFVPAEVSP